MKLVTGDQMRALDQRAINDYRIPGIVLMENAASGIAGHIIKFIGDPDNAGVIVVCGPGNNGGDGLAAARHLTNHGFRVEIFHLADPEKYRGDAGTNQEIAARMGIESTVIKEEKDISALARKCAKADLVVDAIFGTGLTRTVSGIFAAAIAVINDNAARVVAVDIPSGLDSDTGRSLGNAVRADLTVTFGLGKIGHFTGQGPELCGGVEVVDISIPKKEITELTAAAILLEDEMVRTIIPSRPQTGHKGTFGHLLLVAGSRGKTGAGILAARGAMASGCGLVSLAVPWDLNPVFEAALPEPMTIPLPGSNDGRAEACDLELVLGAAAERDGLVIGPGLGTEKDSAELVLELVRRVEKPMVIDADGLNIIAAADGFKGNDHMVLTPHPGEMARLLGCANSEVQDDRPAAAETLARQTGTVVLLKGAGSVIAHPDGRVAINPTGSAILATGGSGDVLAGLIGGLLAQGSAPFDAACLGAYLHGLAAQSLACGQDRGMAAGELCKEIAPLFSHLRTRG